MSEKTVYRLKVTLRGSEPAIWRRILVSADITLRRLHGVLQTVMGWSGFHLYQYRVGSVFYGRPHPDYGFEMQSDARTKLSDVLTGEGEKIIYDYDFGDSWEHTLLLEASQPAERGVRYPLLLDGARRCPPEDCGGIGGFHNFLEALKDPAHPEHAMYTAWWGGPFDQKEFDALDINAALHPPKRTGRKG